MYLHVFIKYMLWPLWLLESLIHLEEEDKPSNIPGVVFAGLVVVLVERAYRQSVAGLGPMYSPCIYMYLSRVNTCMYVCMYVCMYGEQQLKLQG